MDVILQLVSALFDEGIPATVNLLRLALGNKVLLEHLLIPQTAPTQCCILP